MSGPSPRYTRIDVRNRVGRTVLVLPFSTYGKVLEKWVEHDRHGNEVGRWIKVELDRAFPSARERAVWEAKPYAERPYEAPGPTLVHDLRSSDLCFKCPAGSCNRHRRLRSDATLALMEEMHRQ